VNISKTLADTAKVTIAPVNYITEAGAQFARSHQKATNDIIRPAIAGALRGPKHDTVELIQLYIIT